MAGPNTRGFTLIELLIVVVIIGVLASIAIPKFGKTREKALIAGMKADLRNFAAAQESYATEHGFAYGALTDLQAPPYNFKLSGANVGVSANRANQWYLQVTNPGTGTVCHMSMNSTAADDGAPICDALSVAVPPVDPDTR